MISMLHFDQRKNNGSKAGHGCLEDRSFLMQKTTAYPIVHRSLPVVKRYIGLQKLTKIRK